jgi:hypothetical protein
VIRPDFGDMVGDDIIVVDIRVIIMMILVTNIDLKANEMEV